MEAKNIRTKVFHSYLANRRGQDGVYQERYVTVDEVVNSWLEQQDNIEIIDIKFTSVGYEDDRCLVIYQIKE